MGALWLLYPFSSKSWALQVAMSPVSCFTHFSFLPGLQGTAVVTRVRTYQGAEAGLAPRLHGAPYLGVEMTHRPRLSSVRQLGP